MNIDATAISRLRKSSALTHKQLGQIIGFSEQSIRHMELGLKPVPAKSHRILANMLSPAPSALTHKTRPTSSDQNRKIKDLPILGFAQGGFEGNDVTNQEPLDWTYRPPSLENISDAFAVFVTGDSMEPEYHAGDLVYVNPQATPRAGHYVLVEAKEHRGFIKKFIKWCGDYLVLEQFNPKTELWIEKANVLRLMAVVDDIRQ